MSKTGPEKQFRTAFDTLIEVRTYLGIIEGMTNHINTAQTDANNCGDLTQRDTIVDTITEIETDFAKLPQV